MPQPRGVFSTVLLKSVAVCLYACRTEAATCSMIVVVWWSDLPWWLTFIHCHQITKLVDPFLYQLIPRGKFQLPMSQLEVWQESPPSFLQWCGQNACLDTNVFSLIFHIVLHQVHWHLFCHLLYYLCAKNHKFGTCRLSARDDNLGVLLSDPPCMYIHAVTTSHDHNTVTHDALITYEYCVTYVSGETSG